MLETLSAARSLSSTTDDTVLFNEAMSSIKVTVHALNKFLQKMNGHICVDVSTVNAIGRLIGQCCEVILLENAVLDCQTSCAMTLPLAYKFMRGDSAVQELWEDLFVRAAAFPRDLTVSARYSLCLLTGLVGGLTVDDLQVNVSGRLMLDLVTERILQISEGNEGTRFKYSLSRCLVVLTSKMCSCISQTSTVAWNFSEAHHLFLQYVFNHLEDPVDGIRQQAKVVFENAIQMKEMLGKHSGLSCLALLGEVFALDWHCKGKYGLLAVLSAHLPSSAFINCQPSLPMDMLKALDEMAMANYVCDLYEKLMLKHKCEVGSIDDWHRIWLNPVIEAMSEAKLQTGVIEYVLPKVLQATKSGMSYIISSILNGNMLDGSLLVLVTCLKRARCLGYVPSSLDDAELWNDVVPRTLLRRALAHGDDCVRVEAFGMICFNPKSTEIIPQYDLELAVEFLDENLTSQSPSLRQQITAALKKLLIRFKESFIALSKKNMAETVFFTYYKCFVTSLYERLLSNIYCGVSFTRRTSSLSLLNTVVDILNGVDKLPTFESVVSIGHAENLLQLLADTFEENKASVLRLLLNISPCKLGLNSETKVREMFDLGLQLITTTRPQDCTTAAYIFKLLLNQPNLLPVVDKTTPDSVENRQLCILNTLLERLKQQVSVGREDLIHASVHAPMYPVIHCIRYICKDIRLDTLKEIDTWSAYLAELILVSFDAAAVVSPVISHASPEGNVPAADFGADGDQESLSTVQDMPEFLVVCSWRTVKEVSLLLGLLTQAPVRTDSSVGVLDAKVVLDIGHFFTDLLLESRHRGAFELAYAGFLPMCSMLWSSRLELFSVLPSKWLTQIIEDIQTSDSAESRLCATRRSAGVPFYILALIVTEPANRGRKYLSTVMQRLLVFADQKHSLTQIHAFNVLRALFKDNRIGEHVLPFVADGIRLAVLGFSSDSWAVRNAATLLFSTLMVRVFGVRRDRDFISTKNSLSGRVFFYRYPALFSFLLEEIRHCTDNIYTLNPSLYPVLMILGHLKPSVLEGADTAMNVAEFIPFVMRCAASPVLKTRQMGARALAPIVFKDQLSSIMADLAHALLESCCQNLLHGLLLQLRALLEEVLRRKLTLHDDVVRTFFKSNWLMTRRNVCHVTRAAYVNILACCLDLVTDQIFSMRLYSELLTIVQMEIASFVPTDRVGYISFIVDLTNLYLAKCEKFDNGRLLSFLVGHRLYEVREATLKFLSCNRQLLPQNLRKRLEKELHPMVFSLLLDLLPIEGDAVNLCMPISKRSEVRCGRLRYLAGSKRTFEEIIDELLETSRPCEMFELRLASAHALEKRAEMLIEKSTIQCACWNVLLTLLLDDDEVLRGIASIIVAKAAALLGGTSASSLSHSLALTKAIELVLVCIKSIDVLLECLVRWICGDERRDSGDGRLFDRGEQSTYEDSIHLCLLIHKKFLKFLSSTKLDRIPTTTVAQLYDNISLKLKNNLNDAKSLTLSERFVRTNNYVEFFCTNFRLLCALDVLVKARDRTKMSKTVDCQSFNNHLSAFCSIYETEKIPWPLTTFVGSLAV